MLTRLCENNQPLPLVSAQSRKIISLTEPLPNGVVNAHDFHTHGGSVLCTKGGCVARARSACRKSHAGVYQETSTTALAPPPAPGSWDRMRGAVPESRPAFPAASGGNRRAWRFDGRRIWCKTARNPW